MLALQAREVDLHGVGSRRDARPGFEPSVMAGNTCDEVRVSSSDPLGDLAKVCGCAAEEFHPDAEAWR
jgi:hypothetical protein